MRVTINFKLDELTLRYAISSLLLFGSLKINKANIIYAIKSEVESKGTSLLDFTENWGEDILDYYSDNMKEIDLFVERYRNLIEQ